MSYPSFKQLSYDGHRMKEGQGSVGSICDSIYACVWVRVFVCPLVSLWVRDYVHAHSSIYGHVYHVIRLCTCPKLTWQMHVPIVLKGRSGDHERLQGCSSTTSRNIIEGTVDRSKCCDISWPSSSAKDGSLLFYNALNSVHLRFHLFEFVEFERRFYTCTKWTRELVSNFDTKAGNKNKSLCANSECTVAVPKRSIKNFVPYFVCSPGSDMDVNN